VLEAVEQVAEYEQAAARAAAAAQKLLEEETAQQLRQYRTVKVGQTARKVGSSHLMRRELHARKVGAVKAAAPGGSTDRQN
jgi:glutamyl-tRNA reductase